MRNFISKIIGVFVLFFSLAAVAQNGISISQLQTEMLTNPEGIDVKQPRFSWVLQSNLNQIKQLAYQVIVASTLAPEMYGAPIEVSDPLSTRSTLSKTTLSPMFIPSAIFSILIESPAQTRYCLPPVSITANSSVFVAPLVMEVSIP
mgnify:CR=1 FL=1